MKKIMITLTALLFGCSIYSQKVSVGFAAGSTLSNFKVTDNGEDQTANSKLGVAAGIVANIPAARNFVIQTGAHWVQKGTKDTEDDGNGGTAKLSLITNNIEVPVNFLYSSKGFFVGAGPTASIAVSGKWKYNNLSINAKFGNGDDDDMKRFDLGANILAGYQFAGGFFVMANFNQGLSNLAPGNAEGSTLKSHYFGIRLGYLLKGKK